MGVWDDWPEFGPDPHLTVNITSGTLTLGAASNLINYASYDWSPAEVRASIWKNGAKAANLSIDGGDGDITLASGVAVSEGDVIELRFQYVGNLSLPFYTKALLRRSAFLTVPAGNTSVVFDDENNTMPVPAFELAFGWDGSDCLKVALKVSDDGGASEDMTLYTRLLPTAEQSSTTIDLDDTSSTQSLTSSFTIDQVEVGCELEMWLKSSTGTTRQEDRFRIVLLKIDEIDAYPSGFPSTGVMLEQDQPVDANAGRLFRP
jgi:hypothetical protein